MTTLIPASSTVSYPKSVRFGTDTAKTSGEAKPEASSPPAAPPEPPTVTLTPAPESSAPPVPPAPEPSTLPPRKGLIRKLLFNPLSYVALGIGSTLGGQWFNQNYSISIQPKPPAATSPAGDVHSDPAHKPSSSDPHAPSASPSGKSDPPPPSAPSHPASPSHQPYQPHRFEILKPYQPRIDYPSGADTSLQPKDDYKLDAGGPIHPNWQPRKGPAPILPPVVVPPAVVPPVIAPPPAVVVPPAVVPPVIAPPPAVVGPAPKTVPPPPAVTTPDPVPPAKVDPPAPPAKKGGWSGSWMRVYPDGTTKSGSFGDK